MNIVETCWVVTAGEQGMRSQALGLAEATGLPIVEKRITVRTPWSLLPGGLVPMPLAALAPGGDQLAPPWPRLIVGCGRRAIDPTLAIKRWSRGRTLAVYVQNPELGRKKLDLVAAMPHDGVSGQNVIVSGTALHSASAKRRGEARLAWRTHFRLDEMPLLGVLVGGDNGGYRLTDKVLNRLIRILRKAHRRGFRIALTPSRRTSEAAKRVLAEAVRGGGLGTMWDETGDNPYFGILALSDRLVVTGESISMDSEALAAGCPVHVLPLEGRGRRHDAFLSRICAEGLVSPIGDDDLDWSFTGPGPVDATPAVAAQVRELLARAG